MNECRTFSVSHPIHRYKGVCQRLVTSSVPQVPLSFVLFSVRGLVLTLSCVTCVLRDSYQYLDVFYTPFHFMFNYALPTSQCSCLYVDDSGHSQLCDLGSHLPDELEYLC